MTVLGIDVGTFSTKITYQKNNRLDIFLNRESSRSTKTLISFKDVRFFGESAYNQITSNYKNIAYNFKNSVNTTCKSTDVILDRIYMNNLNQKIYRIDNRELDSNHALSMFIKHLVEMISEGGIKPGIATLSVPIWFDYKDRDITKKAAMNAGLNMVKVITQDIAIGIDYGFFRSAKESFDEDIFKNVLFFDFGESGIQISLIQFKQWEMNIMGSIAIKSISGQTIKNILFNEYTQKFQTVTGEILNINDKDAYRCIKDIDKTLKILSANSQTELKVENIREGQDISLLIQRDTINEFILSYMDDIFTETNKLLDKNSIKIDDVDSIELLGGIARIPVISERMSKYYGNKVKTTMDLDDSISRGCALYSSIYSPKVVMKEFKINYKMHTDIFMNCNNKSYLLFKEGSIIPKQKKVTIGVKEDTTLEIVSNLKGLNKTFLLSSPDKSVETKCYITLKFCIDKCIYITDAYYNKGDENTETDTTRHTINYELTYENNNDWKDLFIDLNHVSNYYKDIEDKKLLKDALVNDVESIIYTFKDMISNNILVEYIAPDIFNNLLDEFDKDILIIDDYLLDDLSINELQKMLEFYSNIRDTYNNTQNEQDEFKLLIKNYSNKLNNFYPDDISEDDRENVDFDKIQVSKYLNDLEKSIMSIEPYNRKYITSDEFESKYNEFTDIIQKKFIK